MKEDIKNMVQKGIHSSLSQLILVQFDLPNYDVSLLFNIGLKGDHPDLFCLEACYGIRDRKELTHSFIILL